MLGCIFRLDPLLNGGRRSIRETCLANLVSTYLNGARVPFLFGPYNFFLPVTDPVTNEQEYLLGLDVLVVGPSVATAERNPNGGWLVRRRALRGSR